MTDSVPTPVDVEALIARLNTLPNDPEHYVRETSALVEGALRALAAELDKERLAGKNTANMMLDMATENKSLRAELAALRAQSNAAAGLWALCNWFGRLQVPYAFEYRRRGSLRPDWRYAHELPADDDVVDWVELFASPVVPPAAATGKPAAEPKADDGRDADSSLIPDAIHIIDANRVWNGTGWTYHDMPAFRVKKLRDMLAQSDSAKGDKP